TFRTRGEARAFLSAAETALARGEWTPPHLPVPEPVKPWTLAEWAGTVLERRRPLDPERPRKGEWKQKTLEENARLLRRRILPRLGGFELTAITPEAVASWHAALKPDDPSKRKGDRERANAYGLLSRLMREAVDADLIERSPCRVRGGSKPPKPARVPLPTPVEIELAAAAMPPRLALAVWLAAYCGLRSGEIRGLRVGDFDLGGGRPVVRVERGVEDVVGGRVVTTPKSAASRRTVPLPQSARADLPSLVRAHLGAHAGGGDQDWLFPGMDGGPLPDSTLGDAWRAARAAAGMPPGTRFHLLRHYAATVMLVFGRMSERQVCDTLGQADLGMAKVYVQDVLAEREAAMGRMADALAGGAIDRALAR
ncbi:MAG: tyrosine-type recombinase/integrase, partial [Bifidobacteriaceae bacterium]|nr:tyrosine-type recombinase/integrase [Bifidobacteriaceae bacterium]